MAASAGKGRVAASAGEGRMTSSGGGEGMEPSAWEGGEVSLTVVLAGGDARVVSAIVAARGGLVASIERGRIASP